MTLSKQIWNHMTAGFTTSSSEDLNGISKTSTKTVELLTIFLPPATVGFVVFDIFLEKLKNLRAD